MIRKYWIGFLSILMLLAGCESPVLPEEAAMPPQISEPVPYDEEAYLLLGHIRHPEPENRWIDPRIDALDTEPWDLLFLMGDVARNPTVDSLIMDSLHRKFSLGKPWTHWVPGNHDYAIPTKITEYTRKPLSYSFRRHQVTYLILDTQIHRCSMAGDQFDLIKSVCDTISESKYLILMTHKLSWLYLHPELHYMGWSVPNGGVCQHDWCTNPNNFMDEVFPVLDSVQQRGVQVICVAGDIGHSYKSFEYQNENGILFLATGIAEKSPLDKVLEFRYRLKRHELSYRFLHLDSLLKAGS